MTLDDSADGIESRVRDRVSALPDPVLDCERCETDGSMEPRRSSLNQRFHADDVGLKCSACRYYATHGVPFEDPEEFDAELAARSSRVYDFAEGTEESDDVSERLAALGYLSKSEVES